MFENSNNSYENEIQMADSPWKKDAENIFSPKRPYFRGRDGWKV